METLLPLIGVFVGWLLKAPVESHFRFKRKLRLALSDLLEIRHFLRGYSIIFRELLRIAPLSPRDAAQLRSVLLQILPIDPDLDKRYSQTVTAICEVDAIAGHRLRSLNLIRGFLHAVTSLELQLPAELPPLPEWQKPIREVTIPHLEEVILSVAWKCSLPLWLRLRGHFKSPHELPKEAVSFLEEMKAKLAAVASQPQQARDTSPTREESQASPL